MPTGRNILLFIFVAILCSCSSRSQEPVSIEIPSARENYGALLDIAKVWRNDAYLSWYSLSHREYGWKLSATFQSPSEDFESLLVNVDPKSNIAQKTIVQHDIPIKHQLKILQADWRIDSVEAMEIFLSFDDVARIWSSLSPYSNCSDLKLRYFYVDDQWILAWVLTIYECKSMESNYFYINPDSGERLEHQY